MPGPARQADAFCSRSQHAVDKLGCGFGRELCASAVPVRVGTPIAGPRPLIPQIDLKKFRRALRLSKVNAGSLPKRMPVSSAQMGALRELAQHPGMRVTDLADTMGLHQSTISNLIDKLLQKQLVRHKTDREDGRVVHLYLTPAGGRVVRTSPPAANNALLATLQHLSPKTLHLLDRELADLLIERGDR